MSMHCEVGQRRYRTRSRHQTSKANFLRPESRKREDVRTNPPPKPTLATFNTDSNGANTYLEKKSEIRFTTNQNEERKEYELQTTR